MTAIKRILAIDIGGTGLKAAIIDRNGKLISEHLRTPTPHRCTPDQMLAKLAALVKPLPVYDHIAIGFPGVVREGRVITAPHFGTDQWSDFELAKTLSRALDAPARLINDAEMQGLAVIHGHGLELVVTLGTGVGTALFTNGKLAPHLELAHHPLHGHKTYDEYLGNEERKRIGDHKWSKRVLKTIGVLHSLLNWDHLVIGGGNARRIRGNLPEHVTRVQNIAGIEGGAALWRLKSVH